MSENTAIKKTGDMVSTQRWLVFWLTVGEMALLFIVFFVHLPDANKEIAYMLVGGYTAKWGDAVAYWYNSTFGSARKTEVIAKANAVDMQGS